MRHRWLSILFVLVLFGLSQTQALAIGEKRSLYVYRLVISKCENSPSKIATGFRIEGLPGIITALHNVVGCESILAYSDDKYFESKGLNNRFENLKISAVDIEHDVALLWSDDLAKENVLEGGLRMTPAKFPKEEEDLYVTGYPVGAEKQEWLEQLRVLNYDQLTFRIPNHNPGKEALLVRQSPALWTEVIYLQAPLEPGHSGAPLFTSERLVYGVVNGGLDEGRKSKSWAIRWSDVKLIPADTEGAKEALKRLADPDLASSLSFSSTFPDHPMVERDTEDLPTEAVRSYRANTFIAISGTANGENVEGWLAFKTNYNADGNQRSLIGVTQKPVFDQEQQKDIVEEEAYLIFSNADHYLRLGGFQDECLKLDQIPEEIAWVVEAPDEAISPAFLEDALSLVSYLGPEEINGVETNHYLLSEPIPLDEAEFGSAEIIGLELWVTVDSKQIRRISYEFASTEDSSAAEQSFSMYVEIEYSDINSAIRVDPPLACQRESAVASSPQPLPSDGQAALNEAILVEHNVSSDQGPGLSIKPTFTVDNLADRPGVAIVRVFHEFGLPLLTFETGTLDGIYQVSKNFRPGFEQTIYRDFEIFVPYKDLPLNDGLHDLKFKVYLYDTASETVLAESEFNKFSLWQQTDLAGNRTWFSDPYSGLSRLTVANQTTVSPLARDVGHFLSHVFAAESQAFRHKDPSIVEPYVSANYLPEIQEAMEDFQKQGTSVALEIDVQNSYIVNIRSIDEITLEVDTCEFHEITFFDQAGEPLPGQSPRLDFLPRRITLERKPGSWWLITNDVTEPPDLSCQLASEPEAEPSTPQAAITEPILVQHNVPSPEAPGLIIQPTFTVDNLLGSDGVVIARVFFENGTPLKAYSPETGTLEGVYQAEAEFTPGFEQTIYRDFEISVPYNDLHLVDGIHKLKFQVYVYDIAANTVLAESAFYDFSVWQRTVENGNRIWLSNDYAGLNGLTIAGKTELAPWEQDVSNFLSQALEAQSRAMWSQDPSIAEPYLSAARLLEFQELIKSFQDEEMSIATIFDEQNSFIVEIRDVDDNTREVDVCLSFSVAAFDQSGGLIEEEVLSLVPQTQVLEQTTNNSWVITDVISNPDGLSCE